MNNINIKVYPDCLFITRTVKVGGLTKMQLRQKMNDHTISMNELGKLLFAAESFTTHAESFSLETVELTVHDLGLPKGDTLYGIFKRANQLGLKLCPIELGPCLRLQYLDQPKGKPSQQYQAPNGSITVASEILNNEENFPKGFYLRNIEGENYGCVDIRLMNSMCGRQMITLSLLNPQKYRREIKNTKYRLKFTYQHLSEGKSEKRAFLFLFIWKSVLLPALLKVELSVFLNFKWNTYLLTPDASSTGVFIFVKPLS